MDHLKNQGSSPEMMRAIYDDKVNTLAEEGWSRGVVVVVLKMFQESLEAAQSWLNDPDNESEVAQLALSAEGEGDGDGDDGGLDDTKDSTHSNTTGDSLPLAPLSISRQMSGGKSTMPVITRQISDDADDQYTSHMVLMNLMHAPVNTTCGRIGMCEPLKVFSSMPILVHTDFLAVSRIHSSTLLMRTRNIYPLRCEQAHTYMCVLIHIFTYTPLPPSISVCARAR